nr:FAD-dependent oxidoreductase [uncultured Roseococcus sp.]
MSARLPIAIIGAGPVGLAAAAHLLARGEGPLVLEAGPEVAHSIRQWGHVRMFTPWRYCVDGAARALLEASGWTHPPMEAVPTGAELVRDYLEPLANLPALTPHIHVASRVIAVTRKGSDKVRSAGREALPFVLRVEGPGRSLRSFEARAVIDASGTWATPNPSGADGLLAIGESAASDHVSYGIPEVLGAARLRYAGRTTAVIGGGHSALNALIDLAALREQEPATRIIWIMRKERIEAAFGGEELDGLPARGALGSQARRLVESGALEVLTPFRIAAIRRDEDGLRVTGEQAGRPAAFTADELIVATGFRPDISMLREIRLSLDPWLECAEALGPLIDPNLHSCGTVRPHGARELAHAEKDFFIAGMKSYGRAPTFLLATGHEQARSIAAALAGDLEAAARVELELPETGVCNTRPAPSATPSTSSCGAPKAPESASSCCGTPLSVEPKTAVTSCCAPKSEPAPADACCAPKEVAV